MFEDLKQTSSFFSPLIDSENILCLYNSKVELLCINSECEENALICRHDKCQSCGNNHNKCKKISAQGFFESLNKRRKAKMPQDVQKWHETILSQVEESLQLLSQFRQNLMIFKENYGWDQAQSKLKQLLDRSQNAEIKGKLIQRIHFKTKAYTEKDEKKARQKYMKSVWSYQYRKQKIYPSQIKHNQKIWNNQIKQAIKETLDFSFKWINCFSSPLDKILQIHPFEGKLKKEKQFVQIVNCQEAHKSNFFKILVSNNKKISQIQLLDFTKRLFLWKEEIAQPIIQPCLSCLKGLKNLNLSQNKLLKIENLDHLKLLQHLNLSYNQITKIQNLDNLKKLLVLKIQNNLIEKFENLSCLSSLKLLHAGNNNFCKSTFKGGFTSNVISTQQFKILRSRNVKMDFNTAGNGIYNPYIMGVQF